MSTMENETEVEMSYEAHLMPPNSRNTYPNVPYHYNFISGATSSPKIKPLGPLQPGEAIFFPCGYQSKALRTKRRAKNKRRKWGLNEIQIVTSFLSQNKGKEFKDLPWENILKQLGQNRSERDCEELYNAIVNGNHEKDNQNASMPPPKTPILTSNFVNGHRHKRAKNS